MHLLRKSPVFLFVIAVAVVTVVSTRAFSAFGKWASLSALIYINPQNLDVTPDAAEAAVIAAMNVWNTQGGTPFRFVYGGRTSDSSVIQDTKNVVMFRNQNNGSVIATTYSWLFNGEMTESDVVFWDGGWTFFTGTTSCTGSGMYIEDVGTHELGHALGLDHSTDTQATMYASVSGCSQQLRTLSPDDIVGVRSLYGVSFEPTPAAFGKNSPSFGATAVVLPPTLSWASSGGATSYEVCVEASINGSCDGGWTAVGAGGSVVASGLAGGTLYEWQVRARNGAGTTDADGGTWWRFTTVQTGGAINVAAAANGGVATASSSYSALFSPAATIDGERKRPNWANGGVWADGTPGTFGDWLRVDFAGPQTIGEVDVFTVQDNYAAPSEPTLTMTFAQYGITDFQVQYLSGTQWVTVPGGTISATSHVWTQLMFSPVTTSAIRVLVTRALGNYSLIAEVEAYASAVSGGSPPGAFGKVTPTAGATGVSVPPTLSWASSGGATSYEVCVEASINGSCDGGWTAVGAGGSVVASGLAGGTLYEWQVRARNGAGTTDADGGTWWRFTTVQTGGAINVAAAANGGVATASSSYSALFSPAATIDGERKRPNWANGGVWADGTPGTFGDWLRVDFAGPQTIGEVDVFTVQDNYAAPSEPTLTMTFAQYGITDFQVQYLSGTQWVTVPGGTISATSHVWTQLMFSPVTTSAIRVLVTRALGNYSLIAEVEAYASAVSGGSPPGAFGKVTPTAGATGVSVPPTLSWASSGGATSYEVCVEASINGSCDGGWTAVGAGGSVVASGLAGGTLYEWQVRARNGAGTTDADGGTWWRFTTVQTGGAINVAAAANGGVATASSSYSALFSPAATIDGERKRPNWANGGVWADGTPGTFGDWLRVDFAGPQTIGEVDVFTVQDNYAAPSEPTLTMTFAQYGITDFQVQYLSGTQWVTVPGGTISATSHVWTQLMFSPVTTSAIRVLVTRALGNYSLIAEVEAYASAVSGGSPPGAFGKVTPTAGATGVSVPPTLSWASSGGATSYEVCVEASINGSCDGGWTAVGAGGSVVASGLAGGTLYEWQVRARNGAGTTDADGGTWWRFTTVQTGGAINVAAAANGGVATASSSYSAPFSPAATIDGERKRPNWANGGVWADGTPGTFGDWLRVDFAGPQTIGEVDVFTVQDNYAAPSEPTLTMTFAQYGITDFQVQYLSGAQWVTVPGGTIGATNHVWTQLTFSPVTTSAIRVLVTSALGNYSLIAEVEAYGP